MTLIRRAPWCAAATTAAATLNHALGLDWSLDRHAVLSGAWWRILTGHLAHFNEAHAVGDIAAFAFWAAIVETRSRALLLSTVIASALGVSLYVLALCPEVRAYRGLSGIDCALAVELFLLGIFDRSAGDGRITRLVCATAGGLFVGKTAFELAVGRAILAPDLGRGVALLAGAHVVGSAVGIAAAALALWSGSGRRHHSALITPPKSSQNGIRRPPPRRTARAEFARLHNPSHDRLRSLLPS